MSGTKALRYAEETLGVHKVYEEATALASKLETHRQSIAHQRHAKVDAEVDYRDHELEFISDKRAENSGMSQTAFDKFIKDEIHKDPDLRQRRGTLAQLNHRLEATEVEARGMQTQLDIAVARMTQMGGYFNYLAAVKQAEVRAGSDWPPTPA